MRTQDSPYFRGPYAQVISVRWPHGGWIIWNWISHTWDHRTTEEREALREQFPPFVPA